MERRLRHRLDTRTGIQPTTRLAYTRDVELVLIPRLGTYRPSDLDGPLLRAVFAEIAQTTNAKGLPQSASALDQLRTTLRPALTSRPCRTCSGTPASWSPADTCTSVLPDAQHRCADATAA